MPAPARPASPHPTAAAAAAARRTVLVTGASGGIGRAAALALAQEGWRVLAGVRQAIDGEDLAQAAQVSEAAGHIEWLPLDLLRPADVAGAVDRVRHLGQGRGLDGLVNCAGTVLAGPLELLPLDRLREQLELNSIAPVAMVQALAEPLRQARGRVVNVSSVSGRNSLPLLGPYCASKFALEALSDALRVELAPAGIKVVVVQPGKVDTAIWQRSHAAAEALWRGYPREGRQRYQAAKEAVARLAGQGRRSDSRQVARCIVRALTARRPRARYVVGWDARLGIAFSRLPDAWRDWLIGRALRRG